MTGTAGRLLLLLLCLTAQAARGDSAASPAEAPEPTGTPDSLRTYTASAFDPRSGRHLFDEEHCEAYRSGCMVWSQVTYRDTAGAVLAEKHLRFADHPRVPEMQVVDRRDGYLEGVSVQGDALVLFRCAPEGEPERRVLPLDERTVVDGGLYHLILEHWDYLESGQTLPFRLALPSKLNCYAFRARALGYAVRDGRPIVRLRVEPASLFLRLVAPRIDVVLDRRTRHPVAYEGISSFGGSGQGRRYRARMEISPPTVSTLAVRTAASDSTGLVGAL